MEILRSRAKLDGGLTVDAADAKRITTEHKKHWMAITATVIKIHVTDFFDICYENSFL